MTVFALNQILQNMSHLTKEQRFTIFVMKQQGFRNNQIANVIGKDNRELRRNCGKPKLIKFTKELCRLVETTLTDNGKEHKDIPLHSV